MDGAIRKALLLAAVAIPAAPGCTGTVGTTAASMLRHARESNDPNIRYLAYAKLGQDRAYDSDDQKAEASRVLSEALNSGREPVASRVVLCRTLGLLGRPEAREAILRCVNDHDEPFVRAAACRALGRVGKPEDWTVLARVMAADSELDCRIAAIEGLSAMKVDDPRFDSMLADGMEDTEPAIRLASLNALRAVSNKDLGVEPGPWKKYTEERAKLAAAPKPDATKR
jgi:HEAT repeat protein